MLLLILVTLRDWTRDESSSGATTWIVCRLLTFLRYFLLAQISCSSGKRGIYLRESSQLCKPFFEQVSVSTHYDEDVGKFNFKCKVAFLKKVIRGEIAIFNRVLKVTRDCFMFAVLCSVIVPENLRHSLDCTLLCDWSRKLVPLSRPIRCTSKPNHSRFPAL